MADPTEESRPEEAEEDGGGPVKTFLEHLEDLRWMLIKSGTALLVGMIVCLYSTNKVVSILKWPLERAALMFSFQPATNHIGPLDLGTNPLIILQIKPVEEGTNIHFVARVEKDPPSSERARSATDLVYFDPAAPFMSSLHLAFFAGILLTAPFIFYFVGEFVLPALKIKEKKYLLRAFGVGVGLFAAGVCFCYFIIMPRALKFSELFALWMGIKVPEWRAETYFGFVTKFMLGMGMGFELPVVLLALVKIGILDYKKLSAMRRYMIVINLVLGALLTTPEVFTQIMMAVPLQLLYEISVWIAWYWERKEKLREAQAGSQDY
ncbi:MAG: twin-arginine translocase subunit TatC [Verrucomicrobia bacterium]|nr:MAG: twin-arginine translocase subunit TatC [Verrucomicrobiota bacterium]